MGIVPIGKNATNDDTIEWINITAVRHIRQKKSTDLLVSFADWTQGHHGGIYQSASWHFDGLRDKRMDGVIVKGAFVPGRSANSKWGTRSPTKLAERGIHAEPHYDEGKFLYWFPVNRQGRKKAIRLNLKSVDYPKPIEN